MAEWVHPSCGKTIKQRGNRTGHCAACCVTYEGEAVFDAHIRHLPDGRAVHLAPASVRYRGKPLRLVDGSWRGPAMAADAFEAAS